MKQFKKEKGQSCRDQWRTDTGKEQPAERLGEITLIECVKYIRKNTKEATSRIADPNLKLRQREQTN